MVWSRELGCRAGAGGPDRPGVRPGDAGVRLCDARLRPPGDGIRLVQRRFSCSGSEGRRRRLASDLPRRVSRRLRRRGRASGRSGLGDPRASICWHSVCAESAARTTWRLFAIGASIPTLILLGYNQLAFGSPWEMGYFHHATQQFARVHNRGQSARPESSRRLRDESWPTCSGGDIGVSHSTRRSCFLPVPGWVVLLVRRCWDVAVGHVLVVVAVLLVNVFYPEWTGGWSTGPRLARAALSRSRCCRSPPFWRASSRAARLAAIGAGSGRGRWNRDASISRGGRADSR